MILTQEWKNEKNERNETFFNCLPVCNAGYNTDDTGNCFCSHEPLHCHREKVQNQLAEQAGIDRKMEKRNIIVMVNM